MYVISIHVKNNESKTENFSMIGTDFCPAGETDFKATSFPTKEKAIEYLKSCGYESDGSHGNTWRMMFFDGTGNSICQIWKVS